MDEKEKNRILWYLLDLADEYGVPFMDYFQDELLEYEEEVKDMNYWETLLFVAKKQLEGMTNYEQRTY